MKNYLPIDLNNSSFQFIHLDMVRSYGIACKFVKTSDCEFNITDMKLVSTSPFGRKEYKIIKGEGGYPSRRVENQNYGYELSVQIMNSDYSEGDPQSRIDDNSFLKARYSPTGEIEKECIIDLHIEGENDDLKITSNGERITNNIKVDFGNRFCKFYVI